MFPRTAMSGGRIVDHLQPRRIVRFTERDQEGAKLLGGGNLSLCFLARIDVRCPRAAAAGKRRQRLEGGARPAKMIDQGAKRPRADVLAADQSKPIEPLFVRQPDALRAFAPLAHAAPRRPYLRSGGSIHLKRVRGRHGCWAAVPLARR
jgi:hypothetical protein